MTDQQDPIITPPRELVQQWIKECDQPHDPRWQEYEQDIANRAAQWGANTAFEACCEWFQDFYKSESWMLHDLKHLRAACCPKSPTQAETALNHFELFSATFEASGGDSDLIHNALMRLRQLEDSNG